ncbi:MAG: hypothetical protein QOK15_406 [Nocardioidaceae bacterium]|nr:hypothetical protein [Nocardioidaceae bacterium]
MPRPALPPTLEHAPGRGSPGSQQKPLRAATRREALPVRRTTLPQGSTRSATTPAWSDGHNPSGVRSSGAAPIRRLPSTRSPRTHT